MSFRFGVRSKRNLVSVHPDLFYLTVYCLACSKVDFAVVEGLRTEEKQRELYSIGRTKPGKKVTWTLKSKHLEGKAIDIYPYPIPKDLSKPMIVYQEKQRYLREHFKKCSEILGIPIRIIEKDLPHIELL